MAESQTGTVYALVDPRDDSARYIGATTQSLKTRLYGHLKGPASRRVKAWVAELGTVGLVPRIEPINEGVATSDLPDLERAEITRRLIAGEKLLNESSTAPARRYLEQRREQDRIERDRAAWEHVAHQVRTIVGGPPHPGVEKPIPLSRQWVEAHLALVHLENGSNREDCAGADPWDSRHPRLEIAREQAADAVWPSVRPMWGRLLSTAMQLFDDMLATQTSAALQGPWGDIRDASRYLALLPWGIMAVGPWAALAERAGMDSRGRAFIDWVSGDPTVREALAILLRPNRRIGPLSVLDRFDTFARPSTALIAITAAHHPGFDLPQELNSEIKEFLKWMLQYRQLTPAMAHLLLKLDSRALNNSLGPDIAAAIDAQLEIPSGTSHAVLHALLKTSGPWRLDGLDRIVARAEGAFPTVEVPDFRGWASNTTPMFLTVTASLASSGVLPAPAGLTPAEYVDEVRSLWCADHSALTGAA